MIECAAIARKGEQCFAVSESSMLRDQECLCQKLPKKKKTESSGWHSHYVLFVLVIVYIFNFIDRNILSILSQDIQVDLGVTDAQMGFVYGTAFAVFYAVLEYLWLGSQMYGFVEV